MGIQLSDLKKNHCYSFILQHKENRIVVPINRNRIYLAESYIINGGMELENHYDSELVDKYPDLKIQTIDNRGDYDYDKIVSDYAQIGHTPYNIMGVVFKNTCTRSRMKLRNPEYEAVRALRGNQCKDQYNYLALRASGNVGTYLKFYPEDKLRVAVFRELLHEATRDLYSMYQNCYIYKNAELNTFPTEFKTHIYKLHHEIYLTELKPEHQSMKMIHVKNYVNLLHTSLLMNMVNRNTTHVLLH
jgi:hypothetical protein